MFEQRIFCKIKTTTGSGKTQVGTGCAISKNRILTASHVVANAEQFTFEFGENNVEFASDDARVCWDGRKDLCNEKKVDVAVVAVEIPEAYHPNQSRLAMGTVERSDYESCGFGFMVDGAIENGIFDFHGSIPKITAESHEVLVESFSGKNPVSRQEVTESWGGVSGSCLFEQKGRRRLLAVVTDYIPGNDKPSVRAIRIPFLMKDDGFLKATGLLAAATREELKVDAKKKLLPLITEVLEQNPDAANFVCHCNEFAPGQSPLCNAQRIIDSEQPLKLLRKCALPNSLRWFVDSGSRKDEVAPVICKLAELVAPFSFSNVDSISLIQHLSGQSAFAKVEAMDHAAIVARAAYFKAVSARLDENSEWRACDRENLIGLGPSLPEGGANPNPEDVISNFIIGLEPIIDPKSTRLVDVNARLHNLAEIHRTFVIVVFSLQNLPVIELIHEKFPDVILVMNDTDAEPSQKDAIAIDHITAIHSTFGNTNDT